MPDERSPSPNQPHKTTYRVETYCRLSPFTFLCVEVVSFFINKTIKNVCKCWQNTAILISKSIGLIICLQFVVKVIQIIHDVTFTDYLYFYWLASAKDMQRSLMNVLMPKYRPIETVTSLLPRLSLDCTTWINFLQYYQSFLYRFLTFFY